MGFANFTKTSIPSALLCSTVIISSPGALLYMSFVMAVLISASPIVQSVSGLNVMVISFDVLNFVRYTSDI